MLDTHFFWQQTWKREGRMEVSLPRRNDTDGAHLAAQARYALVLDMITRTGEEFWPRYGTAPGCEHLSTTATAHSDFALSTRHAEAEPLCTMLWHSRMIVDLVMRLSRWVPRWSVGSCQTSSRGSALTASKRSSQRQ